MTSEYIFLNPPKFPITTAVTFPLISFLVSVLMPKDLHEEIWAGVRISPPAPRLRRAGKLDYSLRASNT